jgi:hypothetical protein
MKKQITILILLFFNCLFAWSQDSFVKTDLPCDKDLILKTPGRWLKVDENAYGVAKVTSQQRQELMNRLNKIHQWIYDIYPSPTAVDARPLHFTMDKYFASQLKVERLQNDRIRGTDVDGIPVIFYRYAAMFCGYHCGRTTYEIGRSPGCEGPTTISITINNLDDIFIQLWLDDYFKEIMRVEGRPIKMLSPIVGKWKGYDVYNSNGIYNTNEKIVFLLHREGMLPYIPVTRKQYLDRYFECLQIFFNNLIKSSEHPEGLALLMDKKEREEQTNKIKKQKDDVMKYYQDELEATTKAGLLDAPAILFGDIMPLLTQYPIFTTKEKGGSMLVTENPAYIRKDLPKYIPQFIIYQLSNGPVYYVDQSLNPYKLLDDNFPIEKLQAMIDK